MSNIQASSLLSAKMCVGSEAEALEVYTELFGEDYGIVAKILFRSMCVAMTEREVNPLPMPDLIAIRMPKVQNPASALLGGPGGAGSRVMFSGYHGTSRHGVSARADRTEEDPYTEVGNLNTVVIDYLRGHPEDIPVYKRLFATDLV